MTIRTSMLWRYLVLSAILLAAPLAAGAKERQVYTIAVIPSVPPVNLHAQWMPYVERLSREIGVTFRLRLYQKMAEFERDIWNGEPDFVFSSPIQAVVARKTQGYLPLVRGGNDIAIGLFVRKESPIRTIDDLAGKKVAFVGNKNLCSVFIRHLLGKYRDKAFYDTEYAGSTRNVILSVLLAKNDAGAVFIPELEKESEHTRSQLRQILVTPEIAPHPLGVHPRVPLGVRQAVTKRTLALARSKEGGELLQTIRLGHPVAADYSRDYRHLEEIDITGFTNWGQ